MTQLFSIFPADFLRRRGIAPLLLLIFCLPLLFLWMGSWSFIDPDEGRYGQIPLEMLQSGDYLTPRQNDLKFFDKPPLLYWLIAGSYTVFGVSEGAARLVPALAALAGVWGVWALGRQMFGERAGFWGALLLASSLFWPAMGRLVVTDMLVSALVFLALVFWWFGHESAPQNARSKDGYFGGFWVMLALATLAKGPVAVVLTGGCLAVYLALCRPARGLTEMRWSWGVPLFLLLTAPWFIEVARVNPEFNHHFWFDQHIGRFLGQTAGNEHRQWAGYYLQMLPILIFPWSFWLPAALLEARQRWRVARESGRRIGQSRGERAAIFLGAASGFTLLFFSASAGKIVTYILPALPPLLLLIAVCFDRWAMRSWLPSRAVSVGAWALTALLGISAVATLVIAPKQLQPFGLENKTAILLALALAVWAALVGVGWKKFGARGAVLGTAFGMALAVTAVLPFMGTAMSTITTAPIVERVRIGLAHPQAQVSTVKYIRSIPFYTQRRVVVLGPIEEIQMGVQQLSTREREKWVVAGDENIVRRLRLQMSSPHPSYCFVRVSKNRRAIAHALVERVGGGAQFIAANERFAVFGNRAALALTAPDPSAARYN